MAVVFSENFDDLETTTFGFSLPLHVIVFSCWVEQNFLSRQSSDLLLFVFCKFLEHLGFNRLFFNKTFSIVFLRSLIFHVLTHSYWFKSLNLWSKDLKSPIILWAPMIWIKENMERGILIMKMGLILFIRLIEDPL